MFLPVQLLWSPHMPMALLPESLPTCNPGVPVAWTTVCCVRHTPVCKARYLIQQRGLRRRSRGIGARRHVCVVPRQRAGRPVRPQPVPQAGPAPVQAGARSRALRAPSEPYDLMCMPCMALHRARMPISAMGNAPVRHAPGSHCYLPLTTCACLHRRLRRPRFTRSPSRSATPPRQQAASERACACSTGCVRWKQPLSACMCLLLDSGLRSAAQTGPLLFQGMLARPACGEHAATGCAADRTEMFISGSNKPWCVAPANRESACARDAGNLAAG